MSSRSGALAVTGFPVGVDDDPNLGLPCLGRSDPQDCVDHVGGTSNGGTSNRAEGRECEPGAHVAFQASENAVVETFRRLDRIGHSLTPTGFGRHQTS